MIQLFYFNVVFGHKASGNVRKMNNSITYKPERYKKSSYITKKYIEEWLKLNKGNFHNRGEFVE